MGARKDLPDGLDRHYPEERPAHHVSVDGFWMDRCPVTNRRFARFVAETGHVTLAEIVPDASQYPGALPHMLYAGSLLFVQPDGPVDRSNIANWWTFRRGADWRHPQGPSTSLEGADRHPVVHVAFADAEAFAAWDGKTLPSEAEWELAARGGLDEKAYAWGDEFLPGDKHMANTWQGEFPWQYLASDGYPRTSPVDAFPPNGYGLLDMIGNVWEWTTDWYVPRHPREVIKACCTPHNPRGPREMESYDPRQAEILTPARSSREGRISARPTTAGATGRRRDFPSRSTRPRLTSASVASCGRTMGEASRACRFVASRSRR